MATMNQLPSSTVRLISSSQVISSVTSAVKELLENALDAGATSLEVKLVSRVDSAEAGDRSACNQSSARSADPYTSANEGWGLDKIDVRDNGCGIDAQNALYMAQPHYTSKINCHGDLDKLTTYGFRGEALASLCGVSNVSITTKTATSPVATCYTLDQNGTISATKPAATATGTTVTVGNLFKNLPVRKRFSSNLKKCKEELKKVEELLMSYGLVHPALRIVLRHNKMTVWQKNKVSDHRTALLTVFGTSLLSQLEEVKFQSDSNQLEIVGYLPKPRSDHNITSRAVNDRCFTYVNDRPVTLKPVAQLIKQYYSKATPGAVASRHPFVFLSIKTLPSELDVNLDPNKNTVLLKDKDEILAVISDLLEGFYSNSNSVVRESEGITINAGTTKSTEEDAVNHGSQKECCPGLLTSADNGDGSCTGQDLEASEFDGRHSLIATEDSSNILGREDIEATEAACVGSKFVSDGSSLALTSSNKVHQPHPGIMQEKLCSVAEQTIKNKSFEVADTHLDSGIGDYQLLMSHQSLNHENKILLSTSDSAPEGNKVIVVQSKETRSPVDHEQREVNQLINGRSVEREASEPVNDPNDPTDPLTDSELFILSVSSSEKELEHTTRKMKNTSSPKSMDKTSDPENLLDDTELDLLLCESTTNSDSLGCNDKANIENTNSGSGNILQSCEEPRLSEKDWSMGRGLTDKQGKAVEPVILLTLGTHLNQTAKTTPGLLGKRKHSSPDKGHNRLSLAKKKVKKVPQVTNKAMITTHLSPSPKQRMFLSVKKDVQFSLKKLRQLYQGNGEGKRPTYSEDREEYHLIGRVDPWGIWIVRRDNEVICLNQYRLQEQLLFHRLMSCHSLPKEELERAIALDERIVGGSDCWRILCDMKSECTPPDPTRYFIDERLTANGFELRQRTDPSSGEVKTEVSAICTSLPFYGVPDLAQILGLLRDSAEHSRALLTSSRPLKVLNYFKSEAVRIARGLSSRMTRSDVTEILSHMKEHLSEDTRTCLHNRAFFQKIVDVPEHR